MRFVKQIALMLVVFIFCLSGTENEAQAKIYKGKYDTTSWTYDTRTKKLVISGNGLIDGGDNLPDWYQWKDKATSVEVKGNATRLVGCFCMDFSELTTLKLPDTVQWIDAFAFWGCEKIKKISLPRSLRKMEDSVFWGAGLRKIVFPHGMKSVGRDAFHFCKKLKCVELPETIKKIDELAFWGCERLENIDLPDSLEMIERGAFERAGLVKVTIPPNVTTIEKEAFCAEMAEKAKLKKVIIRSKKIKHWGKNIFGEANKNLVIQVPQSKKMQYTKALRSKGLPDYVRIVGKKSLDK